MTEAKITKKCCANCALCRKQIIPAAKWFPEAIIYYCTLKRIESKERRTEPTTWCINYRRDNEKLQGKQPLGGLPKALPPSSSD